MTRPDSFTTRLLNRDRDSAESHNEVSFAPSSPSSSNYGGYSSFPSPRTPQLPPIQSSPTSSSAPTDNFSSSPTPPVVPREQRQQTGLVNNSGGSASSNDFMAAPVDLENGNGSIGGDNDANTNNSPDRNNTNTNNSNNNQNNNSNNDNNNNISTDNNGIDNATNNGNAAAENGNANQTSLQRTPSRPPPRYESIRHHIADTSRRIRHSVVAMSHDINDQFAPRQRRRPSPAVIRPPTIIPAPASRTELRMSSNSATLYDVDLMPPALAIIGVISSFLVLVALIVFTKFSQPAGNIVGIAYSAAVLVASLVVVIRYWLEKRLLKSSSRPGGDGGERGMRGSSHGRFSQLGRMVMLGRHTQSHVAGTPRSGSALANANSGGRVAFTAQQQEQIAMHDVVILPREPVVRSHETMAEADPELPPYSPRRDQILHVT